MKMGEVKGNVQRQRKTEEISTTECLRGHGRERSLVWLGV